MWSKWSTQETVAEFTLLFSTRRKKITSQISSPRVRRVWSDCIGGAVAVRADFQLIFRDGHNLTQGAAENHCVCSRLCTAYDVCECVRIQFYFTSLYTHTHTALTMATSKLKPLYMAKSLEDLNSKVSHEKLKSASSKAWVCHIISTACTHIYEQILSTTYVQSINRSNVY